MGLGRVIRVLFVHSPLGEGSGFAGFSFLGLDSYFLIGTKGRQKRFGGFFLRGIKRYFCFNMMEELDLLLIGRPAAVAALRSRS